MGILSVGLTTFWFAAGAFGAALAAALGGSFFVQTAGFILISLLMLVLTNPIAKCLFNKKLVKTNAEALIGEEGIVTEDISNLDSAGQVKVQGQVWSAASQDGENIAKGTKVKVLQISGVKLIVSKV